MIFNSETDSDRERERDVVMQIEFYENSDRIYIFLVNKHSRVSSKMWIKNKNKI